MLLQAWRVAGRVALILAALLFPSAARAEINHPELAKALAYFERGDFQRATADLSGLVDSPSLSGEERARAREALAVSYYVLGRLLESRKQFNRLLEQEADYQPDPLYVAPEIVAFVADIRRSRAAAEVTTVTSAAPPAPAVPMPALNAGNASMLPGGSRLALQPSNFSGFDLLPFGVAQFRKDHTARGAVLASLQGLLLGANVGLYYYRRCKLKACDEHYYAPESMEQARQLQTMQLVSGSLFLGTMLLGVADGIALTPVSPQLSVRPVGQGLGLAWETD